MTDEKIDLDEAMRRGDPDLIEQALAQLPDEVLFETDEIAGNVSGPEPELDQPTATDLLTEPETADAHIDGDESVTEKNIDDDHEQEKVLRSKNGKHEIPYSVLESERARRQETEALLAEQKRINDELIAHQQQTEQAMNNARASLEAQGLNTDEVFADPNSLTERQWNELIEDYGPMAKLMRSLHRNNPDLFNANQRQQTAVPEYDAPAVDDEVQQAFLAHPLLVNWFEQDPDRWAQAQYLDESLKTHPDWFGKPVKDRFAEVARLTQQAFGDIDANARADQRRLDQARIEHIQREQAQAAQAVATAKKTIDAAAPVLPHSLSDMGQTPAPSSSVTEDLKGLNHHQLTERMRNMTPEELDALFESLE